MNRKIFEKMNLLYERNSREQDYPSIPRSVLLRAPIIIMAILYYEYGGEIQEKRLIKYIKRSYSQLSNDLRKLQEKHFILRERNRGEVKIQITPLGIRFIENYLKKIINVFFDFFDFFAKLNQIDKTDQKNELIKIVLREYLNDSDVITILERLNDKYSKTRKILQQKKYYEKIRDECEQGIVKDTLTHRVFIFLLQNHDISKKLLYLKFPNAKRGTLSTLYRKWVNISNEKYILPYL